MATGIGAPIGIAGAERDDVASEVSTNRRATEQFNQVGPLLVEMAQQGVNPASCRFGLVFVVGAELAEEFGKALAFAITVSLVIALAAMLFYGVERPARMRLRDRMGKLAPA